MNLDWNQVAPMVATGFVMMIPIVAILTRHQRQMAIIMRSDAKDLEKTRQIETDVDRQLAELRAIVAQQTVAIQSLSQSTQALTQKLEEGRTNSVQTM